MKVIVLPVPASRQHAFTLVELAVVLVIIGLIVGGALVGQDMIKAAQIRAQIRQIAELNNAIGVFRLKYDCLPGDCSSGYIIPTSATTSGAGTGNGNGLITDGNDIGDWQDFDNIIDCCGSRGEMVKAFPQIGWAGMYSFVGSSTNSDTPIPDNFPKSKISPYGILILPIAGANWWHLGFNPSFAFGTKGGDVRSADAEGDNPFAPPLSPYQSYQIDSKIDDGIPVSGAVQARIGVVAQTGIQLLTGGGAAACYTAAGAAYNYSTTGTMDKPLCELQFRWNN